MSQVTQRKRYTVKIINAHDHAGRRVFGIEVGLLRLTLTWGHFRP